MAVHGSGQNYFDKSTIVAKKFDTFSQEAKIFVFLITWTPAIKAFRFQACWT